MVKLLNRLFSCGKDPLRRKGIVLRRRYVECLIRSVVRSRYMLTHLVQNSHVDVCSWKISPAGGPNTSLLFWRVWWWKSPVVRRCELRLRYDCCCCCCCCSRAERASLVSESSRKCEMWVWMLWMSLRIVRQWVANSSSLMDSSVPVDSSSFYEGLVGRRCRTGGTPRGETKKK